MKGDRKMNVQEEFGRVMYRTGKSRRQLVVIIAEKNKVSLKTVYNWMSKNDPVMNGVLLEALKDIEEKTKGDK